MAKPEKTKHHYFYILNVKLRQSLSQKDLKPEDYIRVFTQMYRKKIHKESSHGKHCIIKSLFTEKDGDKIVYLSGTIAQFTYIENSRWFDLKTMDLDEEFKVRDGLFPNAVVTDFVFIPEAHRFCYKVLSNIQISPYPVKHFLEFAIDEVAKKNEYCQVDVETDRSTIKKILNAREIKRLTIDINYSNVDTGGVTRMFVENDIRASNAKKIKMTVIQKPNISLDIKRSQILNGALEAAESNGEAEALIVDENNRTQKIKTQNFPRKENIFGTASRFNQLVFEKIMSIFRKNGN